MSLKENQEKDSNIQNFLIKIYELSNNNANFFISRLSNLTKIYWGLSSAILSGKFYLYFQLFREKYDINLFIFIIISNFIVDFFSYLVYKNFRTILSREYRSFIENIVQMAKIEAFFNIPDLKISSKSYWNNESLIPLRYLKDRVNSKSSEEFINKNMKEGAIKDYINIISSFPKLIFTIDILITFFISTYFLLFKNRNY
ncbi:MAG: hypothetical protein DSZ30_04170 [Aquificaceae bacterium]|nr:MAG: hypothetical protein DSZ30_04170 [Aquificaceae bacterium]